MAGIFDHQGDRRPRTTNIESVAVSVERAERMKIYRANEDSKNRIAIHAYIRGKVIEGKSEEEIVKRLNFTFRDKKYDKYRPYFKAWVNDTKPKDAKPEFQEEKEEAR